MDLLRYAQERGRRADALIEEIANGKEIACREGCSFCCFGVPLWVKPPEALQIAHALNKLPIRERREIASQAPVPTGRSIGKSPEGILRSPKPYRGRGAGHRKDRACVRFGYERDPLPLFR
ncbi:MAG: hypothetical protein Q9N34_04840 [Aquificota bacterium]|nr:hypothetical protein [Aquificota bacterium]